MELKQVSTESKENSTGHRNSFIKNFSEVPTPVFCKISETEFNKNIKAEVHNSVKGWTKDLSFLPNILHKHIHDYLIDGLGPNNRPRGARKHQIQGYQLFKEHYMKKVSKGQYRSRAFTVFS